MPNELCSSSSDISFSNIAASIEASTFVRCFYLLKLAQVVKIGTASMHTCALYNGDDINVT